MSCEECAARQASLAASEQLLAEKERELRSSGARHAWSRLLGNYVHQLEQARANLEHHKAECTEEKP